MGNNNFDRFIHFGNIVDQKTRKQLATVIFEQLQKKEQTNIGINNIGTENFSTAINEILDNLTMKELCGENPELAEKITTEIFDFINKTKKKINKTENPFAIEKDMYSVFRQTKKENFD